MTTETETPATPTAQQMGDLIQRRIVPQITVEEFDRRYPDPFTWHDDGCPQFGLHRLDIELQALGYTPGVDYEYAPDHNTVRAFVLANGPYPDCNRSRYCVCRRCLPSQLPAGLVLDPADDTE